MLCNVNATVPIIDPNSKFDSNSCINEINIQTREACPDFSIYSLFSSIISNKYIFGPILILFGIFFCFMGNAFYSVLAFISGILLVAFVILFLIVGNMSVTFSSTAFWICLAAVIIGGIICGYLFIKYELKWIVDIAIAGFAGYLLGVFLYNFLLNQIKFNPKIVFYSSIAICIIVLIFLIVMFRNFVIILCTSFIGAYAIVRGLSLLIGGFPPEGMVMDLITKKEWGQLKAVINFLN
jgi:hypothetical protein